MIINIPEKVNCILTALNEAGYEAYIVGGCVRDSILNREPGDWDITTSATPKEVKDIFMRTVDTGIMHGTVTVLIDREGFEVTTYRIDGEYEDSRHPKEVIFTPSLEEDLKRRDFTINAMAYSPTDGLVDLFGGMEDIKRKLIRCVGNPKERFSEDALRIMRGIRFAASLGYDIDTPTADAMKELAPSLAKISAERICTELIKLINSPHPEMLKEAYRLGITKVVLPEFDSCMECEQNNPNHMYNVGEHIIHSMMMIEPDKYLRLTMMLHDIGKPRTKTTDETGKDHFYGHAGESVKMAQDILRRLRLDNDTIYFVRKYVRFHDIAHAENPDDIQVRRAINMVGEDAFPDIFKVWRADVLAQSDYRRKEKLEIIEKWESLYHEITADNQCVSLKDMAVTGTDLINEGVTPGKQLGEVLQYLLDRVLEDPKMNDRDALIKLYRERLR